MLFGKLREKMNQTFTDLLPKRPQQLTLGQDEARNLDINLYSFVSLIWVAGIMWVSKINYWKNCATHIL